MTAREMAVIALHQKGLDAGDGELPADFTKRIADAGADVRSWSGDEAWVRGFGAVGVARNVDL